LKKVKTSIKIYIFVKLNKAYHRLVLALTRLDRLSMKPEEAFKSLELKFTSGNKIPVTRATILIEEWMAIKKLE